MLIEEVVRSLIETKREDDWWDFKEFHYEDKGSMLHDIICLANNRANRDSYLILGASVTYTKIKWNNFHGSIKESIKEL